MENLNLIKEENRLASRGTSGDLLAEILFPEEKDGVFSITRTFVDESLRGQGAAGKLMEAVLQIAKKEGKKIKPVCSYAEKWFEKNEDQRGILAE